MLISFFKGVGKIRTPRNTPAMGIGVFFGSDCPKRPVPKWLKIGSFFLSSPRGGIFPRLGFQGEGKTFKIPVQRVCSTKHIRSSTMTMAFFSLEHKIGHYANRRQKNTYVSIRAEANLICFKHFTTLVWYTLCYFCQTFSNPKNIARYKLIFYTGDFDLND